MKEAVAGLILGSITTVVAYGRAVLLATRPHVALLVTLTFAAVLPLLLRRLHLDPAVVSALLITLRPDSEVL